MWNERKRNCLLLFPIMLCIPSRRRFSLRLYSHLCVPVVEAVQVQPVGSSEGCVLTIYSLRVLSHEGYSMHSTHGSITAIVSPYVSIFIHIRACANKLTLLWVIVYASGSALSTETSSMYESELYYSVTKHKLSYWVSNTFMLESLLFCHFTTS